MVRTGMGDRCPGLTVLEKPGLPLLFSISFLYPVEPCISLCLPVFYSGGSRVHHAGHRVEAIQRHICAIESLFNLMAQT